MNIPTHRGIAAVSAVALGVAALGTGLRAQGDTTAVAAGATKYTIKSTSNLTSKSEVLLDGEARNFGGRGGGGGGETKTTQHIVFTESAGEDGDTVRHYEKVAGTSARPGRDGEVSEAEVKGALAGKKLVLRPGEDGLVATTADGKEFPARDLRGAPEKVDLGALLPPTDAEVGTVYPLGKALRGVIPGLVHPVRPTRPERGRFGGGQGGRRGRGQGDAGGGQGGGDGEGRRGRRRRGGDEQGGDRPQGGRQGGGRQAGGRQGGARGFRGMRGADNPILGILGSARLEGELNGEVVSVEEGVAKIKISGNLVGKGTAAELKIGGGMMMGRRGGRGLGEDAIDEAKAELTVKGTLLVHLGDRRVVKMDLGGAVEYATHMVVEMREREFERNVEADGSFAVTVTAEPAAK